MAGTDYSYVDARIGQDGAASISWQAACATSVTNYDKTKKAIVAVDIKSGSHTPATESFKLRWRNKTDIGSFAELVTGSGELRAGASAGCITNTEAVGDACGCADATIGDSEEVENESPLQTGDLNCGTKNYNIETQWCVDFSNALDGKEYEFEIYSVTENVAVGTVVPTITTQAGTQQQACGGAFTPTGAVTKQTSKYPSGALSSIVGALSTILTKVKSVAGGTAPSGALTRQISKYPDGSTAPSGDVVKQTSKYPSGGVAPAGGLTKQTSKYPSGALSSIVGVLTKVYMKVKSVAGSIAPSGSLSRQTSKFPSGSVGPAGTLGIGTSKYPGGDVAPSGSLNTQKIPHGGGGGGRNKKLKSRYGGFVGIYVPRGA